MNTNEIYEFPWRPNFETRSALTWGAGTAASLLMSVNTDLPVTPMWAAAFVGAGMFTLRGTQALRNRRRFNRLRNTDAMKISRDELKRAMTKHPDSIWLGRGFEWDQTHAQLAHDLRESEIEPTLKSKADLRNPYKSGAYWIHGLGKDKPIYAPLDILPGQTLVVGTTGAGKTRAFETLITQAIFRGEPVIVVDPKGDKDLCETMREAYKKIGREDDFIYFHPAHPEISASIDPLRNWNRPTELASRIAAIIASEGNMDPFVAFSWKALNDIVQGLLLTHKRPNLKALHKYVEGGPDHLVESALRHYLNDHDPGWDQNRALKQAIQKAESRGEGPAPMVQYYRKRASGDDPAIPSSQELDGLIGSYEHNREHFQKMVATLIPTLSMLTSGDLGDLLSPDPKEIDEIENTSMTDVINGRKGIYVGLDSLADSTVAGAIGSILMADLTAVAADRYNHGVSDVGINVYVDEAAEVINQPTIMLLNKGRGGRFCLTIATQTFADFVARLGNDARARQVLGNTNNLIALRTIDAETQKYVEEQLDTVTLRTLTHNYRSGSGMVDPTNFNGSYSESMETEEGALFSAPMLGKLPNMHFLGRITGGRIIKGRFPIMEEKKREHAE